MIERIEVTLDNQNIAISSYVRNSGKKWLLCLHGIQTNKALFSNLLESPNFKDYSFVCPDFVGFGCSDKPEDFSYDLSQQVKAVISLIDYLNINRFTVIGHSLGGMVGTMMISDVSKRVQALCSIEGNLSLNDCTASKHASDLSFDQFEDVFYPNLIHSVKKSSEPSSALRHKALQLIPSKVFYKTSQSIVKHAKSQKLFDTFSDSCIPRLLMIGTEGAYQSRPSGNNLQLVSIENSGHFISMDNPTDFEINLSNFLISL